MARLPRLAIDGGLHHLVHRAAPGHSISLGEDDRRDFLGALLTVSREARVSIHAYVMLPDRVQLLLTPERASALSSMMQRLGRRYVGVFNARHGRQGSPWAGRYRCTVLQPQTYLIDAMRLIESAPIAAGLVERADQWLASSAAHHFGRRVDPLVSEHPGYWRLGNTPFEREACYRSLCEQGPSAATAAAIQQATEGGWVLGDAEFLAELGSQQARRLLPKPRGRRAGSLHSDPNYSS